MCAIVDTNVAHEVFGADLPLAGERFFNWIEKGSERLVAGGKLLDELGASEGFSEWARIAVSAGKMRIVPKDKVNTKTAEIENQGGYESDDPHVLALAQVSGARLLYSNDAALQKDFKSKHLIDKPRGKVYSTLGSKNFQRAHEGLLANKNLCNPDR